MNPAGAHSDAGSAQEDPSLGPWLARVADLERKLAAREKTIEVLIARQLSANVPQATMLNTLEQSISLQMVVARKTQELARERAQLEQTLFQLKSAQARLLQAQKMESIGQLAAGIAHEINTPTQFVSDNINFLHGAFVPLFQLLDLALAMAEVAKSGPIAPGMISDFAAATNEADLDFLREQIPMALDQSADGLARIATIVKAMKTFSHSAGEIIRPENLEAIVRTAVIVCQNEWKTVADLKIEVAPGMPLVPCLRDEIGQLVLNLVVNSCHAISARKAEGDHADGQITIAIGRVDQNVEMRFTDNGAGIPEAIRNRVFDPFFTTKPVGVGSGQGLAIAYSTVVERHHGQITLESEVGHGTRFLVCLPLDPPVPVDAQSP
jgi:two-component system, NtrC family, sensor kinase